MLCVVFGLLFAGCV